MEALVAGASSAPTSPHAGNSSANGGGGGGGGAKAPSSARAAAAALHIPSRKLLFPIIPPSQRCGKCGPCLNPKLKKACREARKRQLELGLALPGTQLAATAASAGVALSPAAAAAVAAGLGGGVGGKRATAAATAAAVAAGRALGTSLLGCRIRIYWAGMRRWYEGRISEYCRKDG